jgi:hypothetical protein
MTDIVVLKERKKQKTGHSRHNGFVRRQSYYHPDTNMNLSDKWSFFCDGRRIFLQSGSYSLLNHQNGGWKSATHENIITGYITKIYQ